MIRFLQRNTLLFVVLSLLFLSITKDNTDTIAGKVVGISDGDTITLLIGGQQEKVRLEGIDCPEKGQAFGQKAKQFASNMVYGRTVSLLRTGTGGYGRTLGLIQVDGKVLNHELIKAGYAWHFKNYSSSPVLSLLEEEARRERKGLWVDKDPVPPWSYRKISRNRRKQTGFNFIKQEPVLSRTQGIVPGVIFHGNVKSYKFHRPGCRSYSCKHCIEEFSSIDEAISAGYEPCKNCLP